MTQTNPSNSQLSILGTIQKVEGFDPAAFAVEYTDLSTNEKRKRLPVMAQMAWFRLRYPEGKLAVTVQPGNDCFVATARVYVNYKDPVDSYLSEATASRKYDPAKPSVSPREWAQTAAVGIALRNAGFGLQFNAAGDEFDAQVPDELGTTSHPTVTAATPTPAAEQAGAPAAQIPVEEPAPASAPEPGELTPEQQFQQACSVMCPIKKHRDKTLGEVLNLDPNAINWLATKFGGDEQVKAAATFICSYALQQATA